MDNNCDELDLNTESHSKGKLQITTPESPHRMLRSPLQSLVISGEKPHTQDGASDVELPSVIEKYMTSGTRIRHSLPLSLQSMPHGKNSNLNDLGKV